MQLKQLINSITATEVIGSVEKEITGISFDSRKVEPGSLFVAQKGVTVDGHRFMGSAVDNGASAVVCEQLPENPDPVIAWIRVEDTTSCLGLLAAAWYNHPSTKMKVIGITGTNGKTSIATQLHRLFLRLGYRAGLISTISYCINEKETTATHTTPDALRIQQLLAEMAGAGCAYCFMEVSSHAVAQKRIWGIQFSGGLFTNITHDHLDYHKTFAAYIKAKKGFFDILPKEAFALVNMDDKNGPVMLQNTKGRKVTFSTRAMADYRCKVLEHHFDGMLLNIDGQELWTRFVGHFNASNLLAVFAAAMELEQDRNEVLQILSTMQPVKGRFETLRSTEGKLAIVDYAHTPDALKNVLTAIEEIRSGNEQVITVVGAGGDRDKTKRPEMAHEALIRSDKVILTSDNPRSEDPAAIIKDMEAGVKEQYRKKVVSIENRRDAIKTAVLMAQPGDIILVAGKGHENYQEIKGVKYHFDDAEIINELFGK